MVRTIAFYLPQFFPTPENDLWWGKGFTEWTNVGRAKPLFPGHYQPRIPADLGYYDLRVPQIRAEQAKMAKEAGIEGFCYWHYWFSGKRLLNYVMDEVINSGEPDYPFCLCWANHSWKAKTWDPVIPDKMLIEQTYPGEEDYFNHFQVMLPVFRDKRYIRVDGKLLFGIFDPGNIPNMEEMACVWNDLAIKNGFPGFCFFAFAQGQGALESARDPVYNKVVYDAMFDAVHYRNSRLLSHIKAKLATLLDRPFPISYDLYTQVALKQFDKFPNLIPCIDPNFDHSPRSGAKGVILHGSTPEKWGVFFRQTSEMVSLRNKDNLLFIKAWNEWGEGNYLEPDIRFGRAYLDKMMDL
jgi:hypothetical protein